MAGRDQRSDRTLQQPVRLPAPSAPLVRRVTTRSSSTASSTSSCPRRRPAADVVLPVTVGPRTKASCTNAEGRVVKHNKAAEPPLRGPHRLVDHLRARPTARARATSSSSRQPNEILEELRRRVAWRRGRLLRHHLRETRGRPAASSGPAPSSTIPARRASFEDRFSHPDGKARFHAVKWRAASRGRPTTSTRSG